MRRERSDLGVGVRRIADAQAVRARDEAPEQRVGRAGHDQAADRGGMAAGAGERGPQRAGDGRVERGALEHEHGRLRLVAAQVDDAVEPVELRAVQHGDQLTRYAGAQEGGGDPLSDERGRGRE